jgi:hypothetical protein
MAWEERYGGIWNIPIGSGDTVLSEHHLTDLDLVTMLVKRADGLLSATVLKKGHDPQWRLPFWSPLAAPAIVETMTDAHRYFEAAISRK